MGDEIFTMTELCQCIKDNTKDSLMPGIPKFLLIDSERLNQTKQEIASQHSHSTQNMFSFFFVCVCVHVCFVFCFPIVFFCFLFFVFYCANVSFCTQHYNGQTYIFFFGFSNEKTHPSRKYFFFFTKYLIIAKLREKKIAKK